MTLEQYIDNLDKRYRLGNATEHTFRGDLQQLLESLMPTIRATNEPKRQSCGAPDYILTKKDIPVGFIEAKDIGDKDLDGTKKTGNKEQFDRYKASLNNLIFTDYINFHLYREGEFITKISIAEITDKGIKPLPENFGNFENLIKDFCTHIGQTIKSPKKLAEMMAGKARLLSDIIEKSLTSDEENQENSTLKEQMLAFKQILIHDITPQGFADVYAQTIAYGMFAARLHDPTLDNFSRQEAAELIPKSNPFLRKLFGYIAGPDIDDRIKWVVENLSEIFLACNVEEILKNYGKSTKMEDPIIHFYETFLSEYDPKLRKARGVWYTPQPVVNFIVRAVDDILKTEFDLPQGLADTSKTTIKVNTQTADKRSATGYKQMEQEVHKVQILDPATGTGTFLAEVVKHIHKKFQGQQGIWSNYVETHLLPRLNGFELLMASYAMAHLKLDLLLTETGYKPTTNQRFRVYLTNSLEEHHQDTGTLFANWLSKEANEANHIKRDTPVMCVIGNPPYSGISSNNGEWISNLIEDYKYVDGVHFNERKHWLNDDYVKFLRYGQHFIEKNGSGVLAFINPHGFLDNPTFRGMRWHLLKTYDKIYTIDLHGNSKKKETAPDGTADINVFDIQQGVSINIFLKTGKKKPNELGKVYHYDLYGKRETKYDFLTENSLKSIEFVELDYNKPYYFFVPKDDLGRQAYEKGFKVSEVFENFTSGMVTANDKLSVFKTINELNETSERILSSENPFTEFKIKDSRRVSKEGRLEDLRNAKAKGIMKVHFRPFDFNYMYQFDKNEHWINSPRNDVMQHFVKGNNIGLVVARQCADDWKYVLCTKNANDFNLTGTAGRYGSGYTFPLYIYPETRGQQTIEQSAARTPNLNPEIVNQIAESLGLTFVPEKNSPPCEEGCPPQAGGVVENKNTIHNHQHEAIKKAYNQISNLPHLKTFRKELRNTLTPAEASLWKALKGKQLEGRKFRRQHSVGNYILDFYCPSEQIAIELDGQGHFEASQAEYDRERDLFLNHFGIRVLRFENKIVWDNLDGLLEDVKSYFGKQPLSQPSADSVGGRIKPLSQPSADSVGERIKPLSQPLADSSPSKVEQLGKFTPIDILDYIYAVLHSPTYREKYKEFLKIDFPRVPYPKDQETFWQLVKLGREIRQIHLLESPKVEQYITQYPIDGDNVVGKPKYKDGKVYINDTQYFDNVPNIAWEFYIGGYQPAQKWLKDRKDRKLEFDDILHYQKIIVALTETDRLMKEIDKIEIE